jgi:hypothetical protein
MRACAHALVDLRAQAADLALGDAGHAQRLDPRRSAPTTEVGAGSEPRVHRAGRDALHVGLLDHRRQRLLATRRGSRKPGKWLPFLSLGMCSATVPARVSPRLAPRARSLQLATHSSYTTTGDATNTGARCVARLSGPFAMK